MIALLKLVIKGKEQTGKPYRDLDASYIFPRGVAIHPVITINGTDTVIFTETQDLKYEFNRPIALS